MDSKKADEPRKGGGVEQKVTHNTPRPKRHMTKTFCFLDNFKEEITGIGMIKLIKSVNMFILA
jgi:hypothetical protein